MENKLSFDNTSQSLYVSNTNLELDGLNNIVEEKIVQWLDKKNKYISDPLIKQDEYYARCRNNINNRKKSSCNALKLENEKKEYNEAKTITFFDSTCESLKEIQKEQQDFMTGSQDSMFLKDSKSWKLKNRRRTFESGMPYSKTDKFFFGN